MGGQEDTPSSTWHCQCASMGRWRIERTSHLFVKFYLAYRLQLTVTRQCLSGQQLASLMRQQLRVRATY